MSTTTEREVTALQYRYRAEVTDQLRHAVPPDVSGLYPLLRYHLGWEELDGRATPDSGGKALRPILCLMACELAGGDSRRALPTAAALELVHNFSLLHDDIQDGDVERRHRPTVWSIWGVPKALDAGNAMCVLADRALLALTETVISPSCLVAASRTLTNRYMEMIEGQYLDMAYEQADGVTAGQYMDMVGRKTGALIDAAMYLGALIATEDEPTADAFGRCGRRLGLAFQVRDDILGIWGDPAQTGKPVGADIRRKKKSLPVVYMLERAQGADREWLKELYAKAEVEAPDVERVLGILDGLGAQEYAQKTAEAEGQQALASLQKLDMAPDARRQVETMAEFFVTRQK